MLEGQRLVKNVEATPKPQNVQTQLANMNGPNKQENMRISQDNILDETKKNCPKVHPVPKNPDETTGIDFSSEFFFEHIFDDFQIFEIV